MKNWENRFRSIVNQMKPYSPIEPPDQIAKRLGLPEDQIIKLDANENPFGVAPEVLAALGNAKYFHIYPDPSQVKLRNAIAEYVNCSASQIVAGAGADELLDLICRLFLEEGDQVLSFEPTFSYYSHVIQLNGGEYITEKRESDYSISLEKAKQVDLERVKVVMLCSPNNPSGNLLEEEILDYFLSQDVVVVVDEAYFEFSQKSFVPLLEEHNNLIILRTFSKCFALAGLRVGYGVMSETIADAMMKIKPPYSVTMPSEVALIHCLQNLEHFQAQVKQLTETREWLIQVLSGFSELEVTPSQSNFVLCKVLSQDAGKIRLELEKKGILVRYFNTALLNNYIRISIGTRQQMETFIAELKPLLNKEK